MIATLIETINNSKIKEVSTTNPLNTLIIEATNRMKVGINMITIDLPTRYNLYLLKYE